MASPVFHRSVAGVEQTFLAVNNEEAALVTNDEPDLSLPSNDDLSSLPSPLSSPDLPKVGELSKHHERSEDRSISPLPRSSPPSSSPGPIEERVTLERESPPGQVYLFDKARNVARKFQIPSTNSFFSVLNSGRFLKHTRGIMHPLEVYNAMMDSFVDLPPTAYWKQHSSHHYLILREQGLEDSDCPGLEELIEGLGDPVDTMSMDDSCVKSWNEDYVKAPPCGQPCLPASSPLQSSSRVKDAGENIPNNVQAVVRYKRKRSLVKDDVSEPPQKVLKLWEGGSGDTVLDPIFIMDAGGTGDSALDPIFFLNN